MGRGGGKFPDETIIEEIRFAQGLPDCRELVLSWLMAVRTIFAASAVWGEGAGYSVGEVQADAPLRILKTRAWKHCPDGFHSRLVGLLA